MESDELVALVSWPSAPLTESLVRRALSKNSSLSIVSSSPDSFRRLLQWSTYDLIDHDLSHTRPEDVLSSSYVFRKALIRKHYLSRCTHSYCTKNPQSLLRRALPQTWEMELSFADELDEMWSDDLYELGQKLEQSEKWWILKPGMADRGMGIRLFNDKDTLQQIFEEFENDSDEDAQEGSETAVVTSQLRHFIVQEYLLSPLLLDPAQVPLQRDEPSKPVEALQGHKFHLRVYCVVVGALTLYMYPRILALFSSLPYATPSTEDGSRSSLDLARHLTNTSLQTHRGEEGVRLLDELVGCRILSGSDGGSTAQDLSSENVARLVDQIADVLAETFRAAVASPIHFQPLSNAFELFGVDFLVTHSPDLDALQANLLEVNAEPAIELTGPRLTWILEDLFESIRKVSVDPFFKADSGGEPWPVGQTRHGLRKCLSMAVRGSGGW